MSTSDETNELPKSNDRIGYRTDLQDIPEHIYGQAVRWQPLVEAHLQILNPKTEDALKLAKQMGLGLTRTYEYLNQYEENPDLFSLMPQKPSGGKGKSRLSPEIEEIIAEAIEEIFDNETRRRPFKVVQEVHRVCRNLGLRRPSPTTIRSRIKGRNQRKQLEDREGKVRARELHNLWKGKFPEGLWPLSVVQFDHTKMDLQVVDAETLKVIGRPYVTAAYDVKTKCILGLHVSLADPNSLAVGLCIEHVSMKKGPWLRKLGIETSWPMYGKPDNVHFDNGSDFRSKAVIRGCGVHNIGIIYRGTGRTEHGSGVERYFRTLMTEIQQLDGTTFSNSQEKRKYDSEKNAIYTLEEAERIVVSFITKQYHERPHNGNLGRLPPRKMWELGIYGDRAKNIPGRGLPNELPNPRRFRIDILPQEKRKVHQEGIVWDYIWYMDDILTTFRELYPKQKMVVKRDPRDISVIYLMDPDSGEFYDIPYKNLYRPRITEWEHKASLKLARERLLEEINEDIIFEGVDEIRGIQKIARERKAESKKQSRAAAKTKWAKKSTKLSPTAEHHVKQEIVQQEKLSEEDFNFDFDDTSDEIQQW